MIWFYIIWFYYGEALSAQLCSHISQYALGYYIFDCGANTINEHIFRPLRTVGGNAASKPRTSVRGCLVRTAPSLSCASLSLLYAACHVLFVLCAPLLRYHSRHDFLRQVKSGHPDSFF